jgi:hypothetical protein
MPCSLLELFFIDHQKDAEHLSSERFRELLAHSIADGIAAFLDGAGPSAASAAVPVAASQTNSRDRSRVRGKR